MSDTNNRAALEQILLDVTREAYLAGQKGEAYGTDNVTEDIDQLDSLLRQAEREALEGLKSEASNYMTSGFGDVDYEDAVPVSVIDAALVALQVGQGQE